MLLQRPLRNLSRAVVHLLDLARPQNDGVVGRELGVIRKPSQARALHRAPLLRAGAVQLQQALQNLGFPVPLLEPLGAARVAGGARGELLAAAARDAVGEETAGCGAADVSL